MGFKNTQCGSGVCDPNWGFQTSRTQNQEPVLGPNHYASITLHASFVDEDQRNK